MPTSLSANLSLTLGATITNPYGMGANKASSSMNKSIVDALANGVAVDQADLVWQDSRTLNNAVEDLDVSGTLVDPFGNTISMAKVKAVLIHNKNTAAGEYIDVGGDINALLIFNDATDKVRVHPGGVLFLWNPSLAGYPVTAGTGDILQVDSTGSAANVAYDIAIIGTSA